MVPKGLKTNVQCYALLKEETEVQRHFADISSRAEGGYVNALVQHYHELVRKLRAQKSSVEERMTTAVAAANPTVVEEHNRLLRKTLENIEIIKEKLRTRKESKLAWIRSNPTRGPRGRGGGPKRIRGRGRGRGGGDTRDDTRDDPIRDPATRPRGRGRGARGTIRQRGGMDSGFSQQQMLILRETVSNGLSELYRSNRWPPQPSASSANSPQPPQLRDADQHFQERAGP